MLPRKGVAAMLMKLARGAYLVLMVAMIAAYAASIAGSAQPAEKPQAPATRMYS